MPRHLLIALLPIITFAIFYNSLNGTWAMDDIYISSFSSAPNLLSLTVQFRKVSYITFYLNGLYMPPEVSYYRLVNVSIHILNTILIYMLAFWTFQRLKIKGPQFVAFTVALIFAVHPINNTSVVYIIQRMTLLAAFFVLLSLLLYIKAATSSKKPYSIALGSLATLSILLGVLAKENAIVALPLILLYDYFFISSDFIKSKNLIVLLTVIVVIIVVVSYTLKLGHTVVSIIKMSLSPFEVIRPEGWTAIDVYWTPVQHLLTETRVLMDYLLSILLPLPIFFVFDSWGYPISTDLFTPIGTLFSTLLLIGLVVIAIRYRKAYPLMSLAILWYFLAISLESFIAIGSDLYFEHRNYLPLVGLLIGLIGTLASKEKLADKSHLILIPFILFMLFTTIKRNEVFKDSISLWTDTIQKTPYNLRARIALGNSYLKDFQVDKAIEQYDSVLSFEKTRQSPTFLLDALYLKGMAYVYLEQAEEAQGSLRIMETLPYKSEKTLLLRSAIDLLRDKPTSAEQALQEVKADLKGLNQLVANILLADAYRAQGEINKALETYKSVLAIDPLNTSAHYGIGKAFLSIGQKDQALPYLNRCIALEPKNVFALADLSDLYLISGNYENAYLYAQRAIGLNTPFYKPSLAMANAMLIKGQGDDAEAWYNKALSLGSPGYLIPFSKARVYLIKGDDSKAEVFLRQSLLHKDIPRFIKDKIQGNR